VQIHHELPVGFFFAFTNLRSTSTRSSCCAEPETHPVVAAPVRLAITQTRTLLVPHAFSLVSSDKFGNPLPLPTGLGNLPLYLDHDGFYSVNGPHDLTVNPPYAELAPANHDNHFMIYPLLTDSPGFSGENAEVIPDHRQYRNDNAISRSDTSPINLGPP